jgi:hypothetical protein
MLTQHLTSILKKLKWMYSNPQRLRFSICGQSVLGFVYPHICVNMGKKIGGFHCGNLPQSYRQAYSLVNRHRVVRGRQLYTLQFATRCLNFNTDASQPASATPAPPPIGSRTGQPKWDKIRASAGQKQSINIHDSALNERASHQFISATTTSRASRSAVPSAGSALGGSSSRHLPPLAWAATLRTLDSRPYLRRQHALATHCTQQRYAS